jgi:transposase
MHKIQEVLRLRFEAGLSLAQIARACGLSKGVVSKYLSLAEAKGIGWPPPADLDPAKLSEVLMPPRAAPGRFVEPDYGEMHQELKRKGVTLQLLWSEYVAIHGEQAWRYSQYCEHYRQWRKRQKRSMRQRHRAGEKLFIDYCGPTVPIVEGRTGEILDAHVFVAVLGASNYTYAEATWSQSLSDWIAAHQRAFAFFGGVPELLVPDNLKSAVSQASRYDPTPNRSYLEMARHYRTAILPARPYKPKDKAKAEVAVQVVERWILARLRHHTFFSLVELNRAIRELLSDLNERPFQKLPGSRRSQFEALDQPALKPLPEDTYLYADWKWVKPGLDYHVEYKGHYYSVPQRLVGQALEIRVTAEIVEVFHKGDRVASHARSHRGGFTTCSEHMPSSHRAHQEWSPRRFLNWAGNIGPSTYKVVEWQLTNRPHPEHGYRRCLGLLNLSRRYGKARLEAACTRTLALGIVNYKSVASILKQGLDQLSPPGQEEPPQVQLPLHDNVRGADYYH